MSSSTVLENIQRQTQATLDGFNALDYEALRATRSEDFVYQFLPRSLGQPARNNTDYADFWHNQLRPLFEEFHVTPHTMMFDERVKKSTIYGTVKTLTPLGAFEMELVMMLSFNVSGSKVTRIDEFFDSAIYSDFFAKAAELRKRQDGGA